MDSCKNKTLSTLRRERNEESCENRGGVVGVEVVVEPVDVPIPRLAAPVEAENVPIAVRVPKDCIRCHQDHRPLNTLWAVYFS